MGESDLQFKRNNGTSRKLLSIGITSASSTLRKHFSNKWLYKYPQVSTDSWKNRLVKWKLSRNVFFRRKAKSHDLEDVHYSTDDDGGFENSKFAALENHQQSNGQLQTPSLCVSIEEISKPRSSQTATKCRISSVSLTNRERPKSIASLPLRPDEKAIAYYGCRETLAKSDSSLVTPDYALRTYFSDEGVGLSRNACSVTIGVRSHSTDISPFAHQVQGHSADFRFDNSNDEEDKPESYATSDTSQTAAGYTYCMHGRKQFEGESDCENCSRPSFVTYQPPIVSTPAISCNRQPSTNPSRRPVNFPAALVKDGSFINDGQFSKSYNVSVGTERNTAATFTDRLRDRNRFSIPISLRSPGKAKKQTYTTKSSSLSSLGNLLTPSTLPTKAASIALQQLLYCYRSGDMTVEKVSLLLDILDTQERFAKDIQSEIGNNKHAFVSLNNSDENLPIRLSRREDAVVLQKRPDKMKQRCQHAKKKGLVEIRPNRNCLEINTEQWNSLVLSLQELSEWVLRKGAELERLGPMASDINSSLKQWEDYRAFRRHLEDKKHVIELNIESSSQFAITNDPSFMPDTSNSEKENVCMVEEQARELIRKVRDSANKLSDLWNGLRQNSDIWQQKLEKNLLKMGASQEDFGNTSNNLNPSEFIYKNWLPPIANDGQIAELPVPEELRKNGAFSATTVAQNFLSKSVQPPWERLTTPNKVPYYINHDYESTHWDHPKMTELMNSLSDFNKIHFSAYRTALKLRHIQNTLKLYLVSLNKAIEVIDSHCLRTGNHGDKLLDIQDMITIVTALFELIASETGNEIDLPVNVDLIVNWILNIYDSQRSGQVRVLSFKIGIILLCRGHLEEKYRYMYSLIEDSNRLADRRKLELLLHECIQLPKKLGEGAAFGGSNIERSLKSCFSETLKNRNSIDVVHFLSWLQQEPQTIIWLPVLHRLAAAENEIHEARCNTCRVYPMIGFRYRCLKCLNFDMCQNCFFSRKSCRPHKLSHPMKKYCTATTSNEDDTNFTCALKNKFKSKKYFMKHPRVGYLRVQTVNERDMLKRTAPSFQHSAHTPGLYEMNSHLEMYANRLAESETRNRIRPCSPFAQHGQSLNDNTVPMLRSPVQIMAAIEADQREELEAVIKELKEENISLLRKYEKLRDNKSNSCNTSPTNKGGQSEMVKDSQILTQYKERLDVRMQILEEHNRQLDTQLQRLRYLLSKTTLQTRTVTASELATDSPDELNGSIAKSSILPTFNDHLTDASHNNNLGRSPPPHPLPLQ